MAKSRIEPDVVEDQVFEFEGEGEEEGLVESGIGILDKETMDKVVKYLDEEIGLAEAEREEKVQQWRKWRRQREFRPERKTLDYPWPKCFPPNTDILTEDGWKPISEVHIGDRVLSREPLTGKMEYRKVTDTFQGPSPNLVEMKNVFFDLRVTPNHEFHLENRDRTSIKTVTAAQAAEGFYGEGNNMLPLTGVWEAEEAVSLWGYDPGDFLEFLGWFISEGWVSKCRCVGISQSEIANPEKCSRLHLLLQRMGFDYHYSRSAFLVNVDSSLSDHLRELGNRYEKLIPRMYLDLPPKQLIRLFESLVLGDGNVTWSKDKHRNVPRTTYGTVSKDLADDFQELCLKLGYSASITVVEPKGGEKIRGRKITSSRPFYNLSVRYTKQTRFRRDRASFREVTYDGLVYDVTVEDWHTIYVRQNGKPLWSGNSANVTVPMSGMLTQNMYAYIKNTFDVRDPLISVNAINKKSPGDVEVAKTLEKYLDLLAESPFDLNLRPKLDTIVYEGSSMGAIFVKVPWTTDEWIFKSPDEDGEVQTVRSVLHDGPEWVPIAREDFLYREYAQDVHRAPWVAHHFELGEHELHNRGVSQLYQGVEKVKPHARTEPTESEREEQERDGILQQAAAVYDLYEVYLFWKLPNEEYMVDIVVTFHRESKTILRAEFNELGIRCIGPTKYVIRPFYMDGLGIGWILEHMQDEVDYHHRLRINNSHFASMMMFAIRRGSGYGGKEKIYPGKIWKVDDPSKDIVPIRGGEIYPASLQAEAMSLQYAERAVGFSDAQRGFSDLIAKSGTSAQLQMFNAQQGGKLINSITDGMVRSFSEYAMFTVFQLVKNRKKVIQNEQNNGRLTAEEIRELEAALSIPLQDIPRKLRFYVRTTDIDKTFEVRRQNVLTLTQIYGMFWEKVIPLLQIIHSDQVPPQMKPVLWKAFTGSCNMLEKVFRFFGEDETQKFVPDYRRMELLQEIREALLGDLDQAKRVLEDLRRGRGETGIGAGAAAAIGGAAGAREAFGGGFGPQEAVPGGRVGASQPAAQPIAGGAGPLA